MPLQPAFSLYSSPPTVLANGKREEAPSSFFPFSVNKAMFVHLRENICSAEHCAKKSRKKRRAFTCFLQPTSKDFFLLPSVHLFNAELWFLLCWLELFLLRSFISLENFFWQSGKRETSLKSSVPRIFLYSPLDIQTFSYSLCLLRGLSCQLSRGLFFREK